MFYVRSVFRIFFREGAPILVTLSSAFFFGRVNFRQLKYQKRFLRVRGHASPKKIKNLHTVMAIAVLFKQFGGKLVTFLAPNFECFTNDAFCSHSFDYACSRRLRHIVMKRFEIMEKFLFIPNIVENGWWGDAYVAYPTSPVVV